MSVNKIPIPSPMPEIKSVVENVLTQSGYADKRAAKMDINDFLALLSAFNAQGIHFS